MGLLSGSVGGGGLIGAAGNGVSISNCYFDSQTSGVNTPSSGITPKTTAEMKTLSTFIGWDFMAETTNGTNDYWGMNPVDNDGYPFLKWQGYKLHPEITWPTADNLVCRDSLNNVNLTGGSGSVAGNFVLLMLIL